MKKAYDLKDLAERYKKAGLNLTEEAARTAFEVQVGWLKDSAKVSANQVDDIVVGAAASLETLVLKEIDKIDGEVDAPAT